jgi:hypothetical protein
MSQLSFACESVEDDEIHTAHHEMVARQYVVAGWTGRDAAGIRHHIHELEKLGVPPPSTVPLYYRVGAQMLTQRDEIEVLGPHSSGEVEPVLFFSAGTWWLTVGSDHTDRKVETYSVAVSKQMCPKPIATVAWRWSDVADYQDELELRSRIFEDGRWVDYQQGTLAAIRPLETLRDGYLVHGGEHEGFVITCGTLGAIPDAAGTGVRPAEQMELVLHDPRLGRSIVHRYGARVLPVIA